jgi:hypothetical protein
MSVDAPSTPGRPFQLCNCLRLELTPDGRYSFFGEDLVWPEYGHKGSDLYGAHPVEARECRVTRQVRPSEREHTPESAEIVKWLLGVAGFRHAELLNSL